MNLNIDSNESLRKALFQKSKDYMGDNGLENEVISREESMCFVFLESDKETLHCVRHAAVVVPWHGSQLKNG